MQYIAVSTMQHNCLNCTAESNISSTVIFWELFKAWMFTLTSSLKRYFLLTYSLAILLLFSSILIYGFNRDNLQQKPLFDTEDFGSTKSFKGINPLAAAFTSDSLITEKETDVLALAENVEEHDEKKFEVKISTPVLLTGFYDDSKYPSHSIYQIWDTEVLYPYTQSMKKDDEKLKLIIQDKGNYCNYVPPFEGAITSVYGYRWGRRHQGIDIDLEVNDPVLASFDGMVRISQEHPTYGNVIIIRHYNGLETVYAHLNKLEVEPGNVVNAGQTIGLGGNTGRSTGSHLHYEIRFKGEALNPQSIISFNESCLVSDSIKVVRVNNSYVAVPMGVPFHSVKKGEYLYLIASKYGTTVSDLCELNGIARNKPLQIGQKLRVA